MLPSSIAAKYKLHWKWLCNRHERLLPGEDGAVRCDWKDSSFLTVARVFPRVGGRLIERCFREWPIKFAEAPANKSFSGEPEISVILPVGGRNRVALFKCVLRAFFGQTVKKVEFIAVEHGESSDFREACPESVRYVFLQRTQGERFNKSRAINVGVRTARAPVVLVHDADIVPPARLLEGVLRRINEGWDAVRPIRFLFLLDEHACQEYTSKGETTLTSVNLIQANNPGLSTAVRIGTYWRIGGHDERFKGWGGEDWEFLDRLQEAKLFPGGFVPAIHLWHPPAVGKAVGERNNELVESLRGVPASTRMRNLRQSLNGGSEYER